MQLSTFFVTVLATAVLASPSKRNYPNGGEGGNPTPYDACSGLYDSLQCCATDVLGVADLDCATPGGVPTSAADFEKICATGGLRARCCVLPVLGQDVLCQTPLGL
ncbi:hypothetical protein Hte_003760 [Hypoxylon texense]